MFGKLENGTVDIYYMRIDPGKPGAAGVDEFLDRDEQAYYNRCSSIRRKNHFLYGRVLVKSIVSRNTGLPKGSIHLKRDPYNRLYWDGNLDHGKSGKLDFNLSHAGGIIACAAIQDGMVGIDVESEERDIYNTGLSFFHNKEAEYLSAQRDHNRARTACKLWTLKESYVKCKRKGFAIPFESFNVLENNGVIFISFFIENFCISVAVESRLKKIKKRVRHILLNSLLELY